MPPQGSDLETTWKYLESGIDQIMTRLHQGMSYSIYMSLYTTSYNYCTNSRMTPHGEAGSSKSESLLCLLDAAYYATAHLLNVFQCADGKLSRV